MSKRAIKLEVRLHGIDHAQYFQGVGVGYGPTRADDVALGVGYSAREAVEDALEQAACSGWQFDDPNLSEYSADDVVTPYCASAGVDACDVEAHFYASVRLWGSRSAWSGTLAEFRALDLDTFAGGEAVRS